MSQKMSKRLFALVLVAGFVAWFAGWQGAFAQQDSPQWWRNRSEPGVYKARIEPHWFAGNARFWYRNSLADDAKEFVVVDVEEGRREPAFDHDRLAESLSAAAEEEYDGDKLPFNDIEFSDDGVVVRFTAGGKRWACNLESYKCFGAQGAEATATADADDDEPQGRRGRRRFGRGEAGRNGGGRSPDGEWRAVVRDNNIFLRSSDDDSEEIQLTTDGEDDNRYDLLQWSPDSKTLVAFRVAPGDRKEVYLLESSPRRGGRARMHARPYALPGDKFPTYELNVFNIAEDRKIKPEVDRLEMEWGRPEIHWRNGGSHFAYEKVDRGHQRWRLIDVEAATGEARNLIDDQTDTFIWTAHAENVGAPIITWLEHSEEAIYASERDGWRHLYLVDAEGDGIKNQITSGEFVVRGVQYIDEAQRQIWFSACGKNPDQDPYFIHFYRINFDGSGLVDLTEGDGNHAVQFSPDRKYLIDTYSRVDMAPIHELRRATDGSLVCKLDESDIEEAKENGWRAPEVFVAKGRDDRTDIWGVICRPKDFDPDKKYPIIEQIYAGPQGSFVPKSFSGFNRFSSLTDLGFIVVQIDGMGTANRSKAFHDVCWHNLKDAGFLDRIRWIKAAAEKYPYMDLDRIGIYGGSAGGQNACAAVLFHPEFYKVAVAGCGCHDNRMDKASWNEQWMGYPVGPHYAECSNIDNAHRLQGKLMLILGEMDNNVPVESTFRLVDALVKADKDFEFVFVPGAGHGMGGAYGGRRMNDFFVQHLQGVELPDHNRTKDPTEPPRGLAGRPDRERPSSD
jgi:dipeptidyl aminopeptidase/acylaminoacyl peptidase